MLQFSLLINNLKYVNFAVMYKLNISGYGVPGIHGFRVFCNSNSWGVMFLVCISVCFVCNCLTVLMFSILCQPNMLRTYFNIFSFEEIICFAYKKKSIFTRFHHLNYIKSSYQRKTTLIQVRKNRHYFSTSHNETS